MAGLVGSMADGVIKEIGNKTREFYEFVLPPIDMRIKDDRLVVTADLPGFDKKDIRLRLHGNVLSVTAKKPVREGDDQSLICNQRPDIIDKKVRLPVGIKEGEEAVESASLADGVLTVVVPITRSGKSITIN